MYDLIVRGGTFAGVGAVDVGLLDGAVAALARHGAVDAGVLDGAVAGLAPELEDGGAGELDARGLHGLPGGRDRHVHVTAPGRAHLKGQEAFPAPRAHPRLPTPEMPC